MEEKNPLVSICMVTYNHEPYIAQAIEGVLMQKTNFQYELVISDDCSLDNTRKICIEYKEIYPDIIKLLLSTKNQGITQNFLSTVQACSGKYIAQCDGDDYWTDPQKLQKQVDILEKNETYSICMHDNSNYYEAENSYKKEPPPSYLVDGSEGFVFTYAEWVKIWFGNTLTWLYRKDRFPDTQVISKYLVFIDMHLLYYIMKGDNLGYYLKDDMAIYRIHSRGAWSGKNKEYQLKTDIKYYGQIYRYEKDRISKYKLQQVIYQLLYFFYKEKKYFKCLSSFIQLGWKNGYGNCFFKYTKSAI